MKKVLILILCMVLTCAGNIHVIAQVKAKTEIATVKQKGEVVRFTVASSKPFIYGSNRYILYIGDKEFSRYEQTKKNGKGFLTFLIPVSDYKSLSEGAAMYLSYGHFNTDEQDMEAVAAKSHKCWAFGKFSHTLLK